MNTYDGRCLYCGLVQPIMAESQEEADSLITRKCDCAGAAKQRKIDALAENTEGSTITIAVGSKGQVKVTRKETRGISAEC